LAVVSLGLANLLQSYFFLLETKGIDLDTVQIGGSESTEIENKGKMLAQLEDETKQKFMKNNE